MLALLVPHPKDFVLSLSQRSPRLSLIPQRLGDCGFGTCAWDGSRRSLETASSRGSGGRRRARTSGHLAVDRRVGAAILRQLTFPATRDLNCTLGVQRPLSVTHASQVSTPRAPFRGRRRGSLWNTSRQAVRRSRLDLPNGVQEVGHSAFHTTRAQRSEARGQRTHFEWREPDRHSGQREGWSLQARCAALSQGLSRPLTLERLCAGGRHFTRERCWVARAGPRPHSFGPLRTPRLRCTPALSKF